MLSRTLLKRGADFNVEDIQGARPDELVSLGVSHDCRRLIAQRRLQHMAKLKQLVKQVQTNILFNLLTLVQIYIAAITAVSKRFKSCQIVELDSLPMCLANTAI
jgi:hypothetical protein